MNVSMDGLRRNLQRAFGELTSKLNDSIKEDDIYGSRVDCCVDEIQKEMDYLRQLVTTLSFVYSDEVEGDFNDIGNSLKDIEWFNNEGND